MTSAEVLVVVAAALVTGALFVREDRGTLSRMAVLILSVALLAACAACMRVMATLIFL